MDDTARNEDNDSDLTRREFLRQAAYSTAAVDGVLLLDRTNAWAQEPSAEFARKGLWHPRGRTCTTTDPKGDFSVKGIHAALLSVGQFRGKVLFFSYRGSDYKVERQPGIFSIWDPMTTGIVHEGTIERNPFCSGHALAANGNLLVVGGHHFPYDPDNPGDPMHGGLSAVRVFASKNVPPNNWWDSREVNLYCGLEEGNPPVPGKVKRRWYPTCVALPGGGDDGRLFIISGTTSDASNPETPVNGTYEFWPQVGDYPNNELSPILSHLSPGEGSTGHATYPFVFVLPTGNMLMHCNKVTQFFELDGNTVYVPVDAFSTPDGISRAYPNSGTAVLLPLRHDNAYNARVMLIGGGGGGRNDQGELPFAINTCLRLDTSSVDHRWEGAPLPAATASMAFGRVMPDAVLLPDGTVLVVGGAQKGRIAEAEIPVLAAECYDPLANVWRQWQSMTIARGYHATALLLPDGRVMSAGSADNARVGPGWLQGNNAEFGVEVFTPPYLYDRASTNPNPGWGQDLALRPEIQAVVLNVNEPETDPILIHYPSDGGPENHFFVKFNAPFDRAITAVALIRSGSVTHGFNSDQRYIGLYFEEIGPVNDVRTLEVTPPPNGHVAPPGFYMLFIVTGTSTDYHSEDTAGDFKCPSVAKFVRLFERPN